jgi:hypothetical protein
MKTPELNLQKRFENVFLAMPETKFIGLTFFEVGGHAHFENICSNILKFYFNSNNPHGLGDFVIRSFMRCAKAELSINDNDKLLIKREFVTDNGRIDLVLLTNKLVIAIENKIRHVLNNDLEEYSTFLEKKYSGRTIVKIVLSIRDETQNLKGGFINVTYEEFIDCLESGLQTYLGSASHRYLFFLKEFIQSIKNQYMPPISKEETEFLIKNRDKIDEINDMERRLATYITARAEKIKQRIPVELPLTSWVYEGYDVGFHYQYNDDKYKLECLIKKEGIEIVVCVEPNEANTEKLSRLNLFGEHGNREMQFNGDHTRVVIEDKISFFISDDELINKLQNLLKKFTILPKTHDELHSRTET